METKVYYVAIAAVGEIFQPTIVEKFESEVDANTYAALMCRVKHKNYIILKQVAEWDDNSTSEKQ